MLRDGLVHFADHDFPCVDKGIGENVPVDVVVRPEDVAIVGSEEGMIRGTVESVTFMGVHYEMRITGEDGFLWLVQSTAMTPAGAPVGMNIGPNEIHVMTKEAV